MTLGKFATSRFSLFALLVVAWTSPADGLAKKRSGNRPGQDTAGAPVGADEGTNPREVRAVGDGGEPAEDEDDNNAPAVPDDGPDAPAVLRSPIDGVARHIGFGYFTSLAPIGVRYWLDRGQAFDLAIGGAFSSGNLEASTLGIEAGYVMGLAHYHYSVVFARGGLGYRFSDTFGAHSGTARQDLHLNGFLGAELFLGAFGFPNVSLQGGYGVQAAWSFEGGSKFVMGTTSAGLNVVGTSLLGFHIYL